YPRVFSRLRRAAGLPITYIKVILIYISVRSAGGGVTPQTALTEHRDWRRLSRIAQDLGFCTSQYYIRPLVYGCANESARVR
ncbi:MAG TPA: hypothetical protein PK576_08590, partial [Kiritimatiellia bacterium]|nr:hypothetical protein [Kiritimatiellia bacterium]